MNRKSLHQLCDEQTDKLSDKWSLYLDEYDRILSEYREEPINLLEIGIQNGGSSEIWPKFFHPESKLIGCDINPDCARLRYHNPSISIVIGDANSDVAGSEILSKVDGFDVVIDDGSHHSSDIIKSFVKYFPSVNDGGIFIAEDLHCSYWKEFDEGGLFSTFSSITFFKRLIDIVNYEHWGIPKSRADVLNGFIRHYGLSFDETLLEHIHSIEFINSVCVIRKKAYCKNVLGSRVISGTDESIVPGGLDLTVKYSSTPSQIDNPWSLSNLPPEEDLLRLESEKSQYLKRSESLIATQIEVVKTLNENLTEFKNKFDKLQAFSQEQEKEFSQVLAKSKEEIQQVTKLNEDILNSTIWRLTSPMRSVGKRFKSLKQRFSK